MIRNKLTLVTIIETGIQESESSFQSNKITLDLEKIQPFHSFFYFTLSNLNEVQLVWLTVTDKICHYSSHSLMLWTKKVETGGSHWTEWFAPSVQDRWAIIESLLALPIWETMSSYSYPKIHNVRSGSSYTPILQQKNGMHGNLLTVTPVRKMHCCVP